jgi:hypothetical protein
VNLKSKYLMTAGVGLSVAAGLVSVRLAWPTESIGDVSESQSLRVEATGSDAVRTRSERREVNGQQGSVVIDKAAVQPLDWSVEELDDYLATQVGILSGEKLARAMYNLFPYPEGGENHPNRLRAGSIPLDQQIRLYEKHLEIEHRQIAYASIWANYRSRGMLEEYRHEFLENLSADALRRNKFGEYFRFRHADYESLAEFLGSDDLATLRDGEVKVDYLGATDAVNSLLRRTLESGTVSLAEIVSNLRSSALDVGSQNRIIVSLEKRAAEIEILLGEEEARGGSR